MLCSHASGLSCAGEPHPAQAMSLIPLYHPAAIHRKFIEIDKGRPIRKKPKSNSAYELRAARDL